LAGKPGLRLLIDVARCIVAGVEQRREAKDPIADLAAAAALDRERCAKTSVGVRNGEGGKGVLPDSIGGVDSGLSKGTSLPAATARVERA